MASYQVDVTQRARREIRRLPGNVRQQVIRELRALEQDPRPNASLGLDAAKLGITLEAGAELRRIRMGSWRIVYFVEDVSRHVFVLAVRQRPPYQYDDLSELIGGI
jgi:mRNA-degrading endonuclease RelE of RelBE toxin-antitoxin system